MRFLYRWYLSQLQPRRGSSPVTRQMRRWQWGLAIASLSLCLSLAPSIGTLVTPGGMAGGVTGGPNLVLAQESLQQQENQVIRQYALPKPAATPPVYRPQPRRAAPRPAPRPAPRSAPAPSPAPAPAPSPTPAPAPEAVDAAIESSDSDTAATPQPAPAPEPVVSQYVMEFNRSPVVGNRLRLEGVYPEARLGITRPQDWDVTAMNVLLRFQHSPSLVPDRSNLTLRINQTSVGSVWLDQSNSQIVEALFEVPPNLIQDYNELSIVAEQHTSETCTNPSDPTLWTEILPDSKVVMDYVPKPTNLDFSRYPYPFIDPLGLDVNRVAYLKPSTYSDNWLTALGRLQTSLSQLAGNRDLDARIIETPDETEWGDRIIAIGQPKNQPLFKDLDLPFDIKDNRILDGDGKPLPDEEGILLLSTIADGTVPVLIATGNGEQGVTKAVQSLVQLQDRTVETGQALLVSQVSSVSSPDTRNWPGFIPADRDQFQLLDLDTVNGEPFSDVTVNGTEAPLIQIPFHSLPDNLFHRGSTMTLHYSHSDQVNPRTSSVDVLLDGVAIASKRLDGWSNNNKTFKLDLPAHLIQPDSVLGVQFILNPKESMVCGPTVTQQLSGTLHSSTGFNLKRDLSLTLPDLALLKTGFPLAAPQDLSEMAVVLPDNPSQLDVEVLLALSKRLGQLSQSDSVKFNVYRAGSLPNSARRQAHLVAIGQRDRFPLPAALSSDGSGSGFGLKAGFTRLWKDTQLQALPDNAGVIKSVVSNQSDDHIMVALTAQTEDGMVEVRNTLNRDPLFNQLRGDTILVSRNELDPSPYSASGYTVTALQQSPQRRILQVSSLSGLSLFFQQYWFLIPTVLICLALLLYSISQIYLNRISE